MSGENMDDAFYQIASMRQFTCLSMDKGISDRTIIMNFRHLLVKHRLAWKIFATVTQWLADCGVMMTQSTLVDATIIQASSFTKNKDNARDKDMHQTKKGNQWYFGMKAHIGVGIKSGLTQSLVTTAANEHDLNQEGHLFQGNEAFISADSCCLRIWQCEELNHVSADWLIAKRTSKVKGLKKKRRKDKFLIRFGSSNVSLAL